MGNARGVDIGTGELHLLYHHYVRRNVCSLGVKIVTRLMNELFVIYNVEGCLFHS